MIKVRNINKSFKGIQVLEDVSFDLEQGEVLSIIGPSGAGKTTLLRTINALEKCDNGNIYIDDKCLCKEGEYIKGKELREIRRDLSFVFQSLNLFPHMTVMENLSEAVINVLEVNKANAIKKCAKILKNLGLEEKENSYPYELSGGQRQRVAIGRALAMEPKYICFDEPTSALDPSLTCEIANIIKGLAKDGIGILIITHDMEFVSKVSTRVLELESGKVKVTN